MKLLASKLDQWTRLHYVLGAMHNSLLPGLMFVITVYSALMQYNLKYTKN